MSNMKHLNFLINCFCIIIVSCNAVFGNGEEPEFEFETSSVITPHTHKMNISDKIDAKLGQLKQLIIDKGLDPLKLPDIEKKFEARPILIKHNGKIKLTKGSVTNLANIQRDGDAVLIPKIGSKQLLKFNIQMPQVDFSYKYKLKMGLLYRRGGHIKGNLQHFKVYFELYYDVIRKYVQIRLVDIIDEGKLKVKLTGNIFTDGFYQKKIKKAAEELHKELIVKLQKKIDDSIDEINQQLKPKKNQPSIENMKQVKNYLEFFNLTSALDNLYPHALTNYDWEEAIKFISPEDESKESKESNDVSEFI